MTETVHPDPVPDVPLTSADHALALLRTLDAHEPAPDFQSLPPEALCEASRITGDLYHRLEVAIHLRHRPPGRPRTPPLPGPELYFLDDHHLPFTFVADCADTHRQEQQLQAIILLLLGRLVVDRIHPLLEQLAPTALHDLDRILVDLGHAVRAVRSTRP